MAQFFMQIVCPWSEGKNSVDKKGTNIYTDWVYARVFVHTGGMTCHSRHTEGQKRQKEKDGQKNVWKDRVS